MALLPSCTVELLFPFFSSQPRKPVRQDALLSPSGSFSDSQTVVAAVNAVASVAGKHLSDPEMDFAKIIILSDENDWRQEQDEHV